MSDGASYCALVSSGGVYCWGSGDEGDLGNGTFDGSAAPVAVEGIGGTGTLGGVVSLSSDDYYSGYCAVLTSGGVDCWGYGLYGQLGNGMFYTPGNDGCQTCGSAEPVAVEGIGGTGTLGGVVKLSSDGLGYCALLASGAVDCWGAGTQGQLGNATFYTPSNNDGSAVPVAVDAVGGSETLSGVVGLYSDNEYSTSGGGGYCALLTSGAVDCWGAGSSGELGDGTYYTPSNNDGSAVPVAVEGVGGSGTLGGVASLSSDNVGGYCALLTSGGVNCWGYGYDGQLGNGTFYTTSDDGSAVPVAVEGVGGSGTLGGVASLSSSELGYCAQLGSGGVDCWGSGDEGDLGNGNFYSTGTDFPGGSAVPVAVAGTDGSGTLGGVTSLSMGGLGYCALVNSGGVDCWGYGYYGNLGNGTFYDNWPDEGSAVPVAVEGEDGSGTLGGIASLSSDSVGALGGGYCGLLTSGGVDCWGNGADGQLGNGIDYTASNNDGSAVPVAVEGIGPLLLAFGDSVAAGEGNQVPSGVTGLSCTSTSPSPYCGDDNGMWTDSPDAYPAVLASELGMSVDNFAISGACAGPDDQANDLPNCSTSAAPKPTVLDNEIPLAKSMGLNPTLITLTVGADDVNFEACAANLVGMSSLFGSKSGSCSNSVASLKAIRANVENVLTDLKEVYPGVPVILTLYYNPLPQGLVSNSNSICSTNNAPLIAALNEAEHGTNLIDLVPLLIPDSIFESKIVTTVNHEVSAAYTEAGGIVSFLNTALRKSASAAGGVTTVQLNVSGHDFCQDYPGSGSAGWIFGPSISDAFASYLHGLVSFSWGPENYPASDACASIDAGCTSKGFTGSFQIKKLKGLVHYAGGTLNYDVVLGINDIPHPTTAGQLALATQIEPTAASLIGSGQSIGAAHRKVVPLVRW